MMTVVRRGRVKIALAIAAACGAIFAASSTQAATVKDIFENHGLLGTLAADCSNPASEKTPYIVNRVIDADHIQIDRMVGRPAPQLTAIIDEATESKPNEIVLSSFSGNRRYSLTVRVERERMRTVEMTREDGEKEVAGGRNTGDHAETLWFSKCSIKITIKSSPDGGGRCIDVPASDFRPGRHLQMWDCNDTAAQTFAFDALNGRLTVADLCVEAGGGYGQQGDPIQLAKCSGAPNQSWKTEPVGNFYKFVGMNGLCIDIAHRSRDNNAQLWTWQCHGGPNQSWILIKALDLTFEEKINREGNHLREFNLMQADAKVCQRSCIDDHQCVAWVYRKPEGRTDHQPHCWLLTKVTERRGDPMTISGTVRAEAK
jgi:hypothetical protein